MAGSAAAVAMSGVMLAFRRPMGAQPPDVIVTAAAHAVGADPGEEQADVLASVSHVAFGALGGAAYALLPRSGPPWLRGAATGLVIWGSAYQGWVPALGILPPASQDRPARPAVMVAAHVVYGVVLGELEDRLR